MNNEHNANILSKTSIIVIICILAVMPVFLQMMSITAVAAYEKTAAEVVDEIRIGWNLGNTFDCCNDNPSVKGSVSYETLWGNPKTTQAMLHTVKAAGFNAVRIPVTYINHIGADGKIDPKWLARVAEVVTYAINEDMYVIINVHHDTGHGAGKPIQANLADIDANKAYAELLWIQIAEYFKDYDSRLIFEGFNETLDMTAQNPWYGNDSSWQAMNILNQSFVDTVRATGGRNLTRNLIVNTYGAQTTSGPVNAFIVPSDKVAGHIIVGVHTYVSSEKDIKGFMERLFNKFIKNGTPVLVGEFGTTYKQKTNMRVNSAINFVNYGNMYGIKCFWWDDGGDYKLFDRKSLSWKYPEITNGVFKAIAYYESK